MKFRNLIGLIALVLVLALAATTPANAQTLQAFNIE